MVSIIIPTLNEERYLPSLLEPIKKQCLDEEFEIVITDAGSQDRTVQIAEGYGCRVVLGGLPAKGRNQGASAAIGDLLLFLDPEALLPKDFLAKALSEFRRRSLYVATCQLEPIEENWMPRFIFPRFFYNLCYNWPARLLEHVYPYASSLILVKRDVHEILGGFDERIRIAEDHDYARRAAKIGRVGFLRCGRLPLFMRRCQKEGILKTHLKYQLCNFFNAVLGEVRSDIFRYNFGQYKKNISENGKSPESAGFAVQFLWTTAYYILMVSGLISWLILLLILAPRILGFQLKRLRNKLNSIGAVRRRALDLQPRQMDLRRS